MPATAIKSIRIDVDKERLSASVALNAGAEDVVLTVEELVAEVTSQGIVLNDEGKKNLEKFIQDLVDKKVPDPAVVACGVEPVHDKNGKVERLYEIQDVPTPTENEDSKATQSFYDRSSIITVEKKQTVLKIHPPVDGKDGVDVYGKPIARKLGREAKVSLGLNMELQGDTVIATVGGQLNDENGKYWVNPRLEINGDVDFSIGNIKFDGEVFITKNVLDLFKIQSKSTVSIQGMVEAAEIHAGEDLFVTGGITGKEKGVFFAGRDIHSKYITNSHVRAKNDIIVVKEVINCDLACDGQLNIENGSLVGGHAVVTGGVKVKQLGSEAGVKTILEVGIDEDLKLKLLEVAPEVELRRRKAAKVREVVEPLLANQKHLNNEQKEKATELLYQAYELEDSVREMIEELRTIYEKTKEKTVPEILVQGVAYNGVEIHFPKAATTLKDPIKGPLKITTGKINGSVRVLGVDTNSGTKHDLGSGAGGEDFWTQLEILLKSEETAEKTE